MDVRKKAEMRATVRDSHICLLLLTLLRITATSFAQDATSTSTSTSTSTTTTTTTAAAAPAPDPAAPSYTTRPADVRVALGEPAVFRCGVPEASPGLSFTFYSTHGAYTLTCPNGRLEDIPQALYGGCDVRDGESLAVWTLRGTSISDNGTRVVCRHSATADTLVAVLHVYDNGLSYAVLIGCVIGGLFGLLLVFALSYATLVRSERLRECFRGKEKADDKITIVAMDSKDREG